MLCAHLSVYVHSTFFDGVMQFTDNRVVRWDLCRVMYKWFRAAGRFTLNDVLEGRWWSLVCELGTSAGDDDVMSIKPIEYCHNMKGNDYHEPKSIRRACNGRGGAASQPRKRVRGVDRVLGGDVGVI